MVETSYEELHDLIQKGEAARKYAWDHYEELAAREAVYTLYGPYSVFMGAATPSHFVRSRERRLLKKTKREKYTKYELDRDFRIIRVSLIRAYDKVESIHHVFELNGVTYGCPFEEDGNRFADNRTESYKLAGGKPIYYAQTSANRIFCEFYEYPSAEKRMCTGYLYSRTCQKTVYRLDPDWDAPLGAPTSPVIVDCYESTPWDLDFSKYFSGQGLGINSES